MMQGTMFIERAVNDSALVFGSYCPQNIISKFARKLMPCRRGLNNIVHPLHNVVHLVDY